MEIPNKVRIGSVDYNVELTDETLVLNTQQSLGIIDYDNNKIRIVRVILNFFDAKLRHDWPSIQIPDLTGRHTTCL